MTEARRKQIEQAMTPNRCYSPEVARALGDIPTAIYCQHLLFWSNKGRRTDGWFYKSVALIEQETALSRAQQERCRLKLQELKIINAQVMQAPGGGGKLVPTMHFRFNLDALLTLMDAVIICGKVANDPVEGEGIICEKPAHGNCGKVANETGVICGKLANDLPYTENTSSENTEQNTTGSIYETGPQESGTLFSPSLSFSPSMGDSQPVDAPESPAAMIGLTPPIRKIKPPYPAMLIKPASQDKDYREITPEDFQYPHVAICYRWLNTNLQYELPMSSRWVPTLEEQLRRLTLLAQDSGHKLTEILALYFDDEPLTRAALLKRLQRPSIRGGIEQMIREITTVIDQYGERPADDELHAVREVLAGVA